MEGLILTGVRAACSLWGRICELGIRGGVFEIANIGVEIMNQ